MIFFAPVELAASAPRGQEAGLLLALQTAEVPAKHRGKSVDCWRWRFQVCEVLHFFLLKKLNSLFVV